MKKAVFFCWFLVSLAILVAMYHLFFTRELRLYGGKSVSEQRQEVFRRAGMPVELLPGVAAVAQKWPLFTRYQSHGDPVRLSYVHYLLAPRVPVAASDRHLVLDHDRIFFRQAGRHGGGNSTGTMQEGSRTPRPDTAGRVGDQHGIRPEMPAPVPEPDPAPWSFLIAVVLAAGAALGIRVWPLRERSTLPEAVVLAIFTLAVCAVAARWLFGDARVGFFLFSLLGGMGWLLAAGVAARGRWSPVARRMTVNTADFVDCFPLAGLPGRLGQWCGRMRRAPVVLLSCFLVAAASVWAFVMGVVVVPDDWDAWAIWGAKAKVLAMGTGPLADVARFGHGDYPLLWPALWGFSGWLAGGWEEMWSRGWGALFLLLCCRQIFLIVNDETGDRSTGALAAALFASIPNVPLIASWSYAEAPLWLCLCAAIGAAFRWRRSGLLRDAAVAGVCASAAAWTKNEGVLFFLVLALFFLFGQKTVRLKALGIYAACMLFFYAPWVAWVRLVQEMGDHATAGLKMDLHAVGWALDRSPAAIEAVFRMWRDPRQWSIVGAGLGAAWLYAMMIAPWKKRAELLLPALLLAGFFMVILFHQAEVYWQVGTSWNRLTAQTLPFFLVTTVSFFAARSGILREQQ